jgi:hypothetical protein
MPTLPERLPLLSLDDDGQPRDPRSALSYAHRGRPIRRAAPRHLPGPGGSPRGGRRGIMR